MIPADDPDLLRRLLRAKDRMDAASHEAWPVDRLAQVSGVSEAHFTRSFKDAFGVPPHRYLLTRRIERAIALLRDSDLSVTEVAFQMLMVDDCRAAYKRLSGVGVEFIQEPVDRYGAVDAGF